MTEFIREAAVRHEVLYRRAFRLPERPSSGYMFACDADGKVDREALSEQARRNLDDCLAGRLAVVDEGVQRIERRWVEPALIRCDCGDEVELARFTNTCTGCGRDYNAGGSLLAPREQWGEETGEALADILRIP